MSLCLFLSFSFLFFSRRCPFRVQRLGIPRARSLSLSHPLLLLYYTCSCCTLSLSDSSLSLGLSRRLLNIKRKLLALQDTSHESKPPSDRSHLARRAPMTPCIPGASTTGL